MASWDNRTVTNEHLLPYVDSSTAPPDIKAALQTLPFERNVFKVKASSPPYQFPTETACVSKTNRGDPQLLANGTVSFKPFMALLTTLWSKDRKIRSSEWQLVVLRTAANLDAPYEWDVNEPVARIFGMGDEHFRALRDVGRELPEGLFTERQRLIGIFVDQLSRGDRVDGEMMGRMKGVFSDEEIMELFYAQGVYAFLARMMNSCRIDFDPPIEGLEEMLRKVNAEAIEKEKQQGLK
jgi:alkylhydroperoxidase family enzyme